MAAKLCWSHDKQNRLARTVTSACSIASIPILSVKYRAVATGKKQLLNASSVQPSVIYASADGSLNGWATITMSLAE